MQAIEVKAFLHCSVFDRVMALLASLWRLENLHMDFGTRSGAFMVGYILIKYLQLLLQPTLQSILLSTRSNQFWRAVFYPSFSPRHGRKFADSFRSSLDSYGAAPWLKLDIMAFTLHLECNLQNARANVNYFFCAAFLSYFLSKVGLLQTDSSQCFDLYQFFYCVEKRVGQRKSKIIGFEALELLYMESLIHDVSSL